MRSAHGRVAPRLLLDPVPSIPPLLQHPSLEYLTSAAGYSGDVWNVQPAPADHPWRTMKNQAMTPHTSGTTLDAQVGHTYVHQTLLIISPSKLTYAFGAVNAICGRISCKLYPDFARLRNIYAVICIIYT